MPLDPSEIRVQAPCSADWETMAARKEGRHCAQCDRLVYDLARMSEGAVRALAAQRGRRKICVRYAVREDVGVHTAPRPLGPTSRLGAQAGPVLVAASVAVASACAPAPAAAPVVAPDPVQVASRAITEVPGAPATVPAQDGKPPSYADAFAASAHNPDAPDKDREAPEKSEEMMIMGEWE